MTKLGHLLTLRMRSGDFNSYENPYEMTMSLQCSVARRKNPIFAYDFHKKHSGEQP
jgi:hypothetical protein